MTVSETMDSMAAGLEALLAAVRSDDPKQELAVRVGDLMKDLTALTAALSDQVVVPKEPSVDELGGFVEHGLCYGISCKDGRTCARNLLIHFDIKFKASALPVPPPSSTAGEGKEQQDSIHRTTGPASKPVRSS